jgi:hypothetical protein
MSCVWLLGRTGHGAAVAACVVKAEAAVVTARCDVSSPEEMAATWRAIRGGPCPLDMVHAGGIMQVSPTFLDRLAVIICTRFH